MSKKDKLLKRISSRPKDFTYNELKSLLESIGYMQLKKGKTSGSRTAFFSKRTLHVIRLHKPHPKNILKQYQIDYLIEELKNIGLIK